MIRRPVVPLSLEFERLLRLVSLFWALAAIVGIEAADALDLIHHRPGFASYELTVRPAFLAAFAVGAALAWRWLLLGGLLATATAATMVAWYVRQLEPVSAAVVVAVFAVPGLAWVLLDLHDSIRHRAVLGATLAAVVALAGFGLGSSTWDRLFGPTHPTSVATTPVGSRVDWIWTGAVTADSATVVAAPDGPGDWDVVVRAGDGTPVDRVRAVRNGRVVRAELHSLSADTVHAIRIVQPTESSDDGIDEATFRTFPDRVDDGDGDGHGVTIAFGSCIRTGSNGAVFDRIAALSPDLFVQVGDLHYADIVDDDPDAFRDVLDVALSRPGPSHLFRSTPVAYVWDDHDYGSNNADAASTSRPAAMQVYRQYVPHYPVGGDDTAIFQAFDVGDVRVLLTDVRSARETGTTMLGAEQLRWLQDELLEAHASRSVTILVSPVGWIGAPTPGGDAWGGFPDERRFIADFIAEHDIDRLVLVSGDAHMVAIDDGTNSGYSTAGAPGFPVLNAAALDRPGTVKGGPYSEGTFPGGGQFGVVEVTDVDGGVRVRLSGSDWTGRTIVSYEREFPVDTRNPIS